LLPVHRQPAVQFIHAIDQMSLHNGGILAEIAYTTSGLNAWFMQASGVEM